MKASLQSNVGNGLPRPHQFALLPNKHTVSQSRDLPLIGVVGGIGSGKSSVSRGLAELRPVLIIDADKIGHELLNNPEVKQELRNAFGSSIFENDGSVSRPKLAALVFGNSESQAGARGELNAILHPRIRTEVKSRIAAAEKDGQTEAVILDAALMLETGWAENCDTIVFIDVPAEARRHRVVENRGWTTEEFEKREANQFTTEKKKALSHHIIDNSTTREASAIAFEQVLQKILSDFHSHKNNGIPT